MCLSNICLFFRICSRHSLCKIDDDVPRLLKLTASLRRSTAKPSATTLHRRKGPCLGYSTQVRTYTTTSGGLLSTLLGRTQWTVEQCHYELQQVFTKCAVSEAGMSAEYILAYVLGHKTVSRT